MDSKHIKIIVMRDKINYDMIQAVNGMDDILDKILDFAEKNEDPPKELYIALNEHQAVLDSLLAMRSSGM